MNLPPPESPTLDPVDPREEARRQFLAACEASRGSPPPAVEPFVATLAEPDRTLLRADLEALRRGYDQGTLDLPASASGRGSRTDLLGAEDARRAKVQGSLDTAAEAGGTVDHAPTAGGTVDHVPTAGGTVDHVPGPGGTVDHVPRDKGAGDLSSPQTVAGYEIIGVLGRGAMGVVYKARQRGLKRLVALKMILAGDHASEHDLTRFRSEAEAVARLQHPGIVQIYEVGEDAGRPFFSLEYIDGIGLDKKIRGTPVAPKEAASLVQQMAGAMDYAHRAGVVHRDLKPANVLLTSDGVPKIGDFGLAKRLEEEESGLTRSGTVLGTPSYMSPEQAEGKIHEVGPLADVYSLGAILYELLTGRPPFRGTTILDTLQQLRTLEPVPPTQLQPGVPRDLETICLKCLQKERGKRYASAADLAADLQRFANNEPILARPIGRAERLWRLCRRYPRTAGLIAASACLVVAWATTSSLLAWQLKVKKDEAEQARSAAVRSEGEAIFQKGVAVKEKLFAQNEEERARQAADIAIKQIGELVNTQLTRLQSKSLAIKGGTEIKNFRRLALADLKRGLQAASTKLKQSGTKAAVDLARAQVLGDTHMRLGQSKEAADLYQEGHRAASEWAQREPNNDRVRGNLAVMETRLGDVALELLGDARTARDHYRKARTINEDILLRPRGGQLPSLEVKRSISHDDVLLAQALLSLGRPVEAQKHLLEALAYRQEWGRGDPTSDEAVGYTADAWMWLGAVAWRVKDASMRESFETSQALFGQLMKKFPQSILLMTDMADVKGLYGDALLRQDRTEEAEKLHRESMRSLEKAIAGNPDDISRQPRLALAHERLALTAARLNRRAEAKKHHEQAMQLRKELWEVDPANLSRQTAFVVAMARAGDHANASRLAASIRPRMVKSTELMLQIARCYAICAAGDAAGRLKHIEQALAALAEATREDYQDVVALQTDPDLASLRDESAFKVLLDQIGRR